MMTFDRKVGRVAGLVLALWIVGSAHVAVAVDITFESPTYNVGNLIGQDGWVQNAYVTDPFFGGPNGTVTVSTSTPLAGARSLLFNQTSVTGTGGSPGASDLSKPEVITIAPGLSGSDLTVSYLISAMGNAQDPVGTAGIFLSAGAAGGSSPIFARLDGASLFVSDTGAVAEVPGFVYFAGDVLEMTMNVDFDTSTYELSVNNRTTGLFEFSQTFGYLAPFAPEGPNGEYIVDVGTLLRRGTAKIDNISLVAGTGPLVAELTWANNASGNWNQATNWTPGGVPGSSPGRQTAIFGGAITSTQTVFTNSSRSVNEVQFNNTNSYIIAGTGSLDLQADTSGGSPILPSIQVVSGHHEIQAKVNLLDDATVTAAGGASITFNNQIDLGGNTLTTNGSVNINHSTINGGTIIGSGSLGTLGSADIGGDLISTGALLIDVGQGGADIFRVAGHATLSGVVDVALAPGYTPATPLTIVAAGGTLDAAGLSLDASDIGTFALSVSGSNLMLTYLGAAVPEPTSLVLAVFGAAVVLMRRRAGGLARQSVYALTIITTLVVPATASAQLISFENPPYTAGQTIVGQDGWIANGYVLADPFFGGVVNGDRTIVTTNPIAGAQSVLYVQTVDPPAAGGTGAADVGKPYAFFGVEDGTTAVDVTASFLIRTDSNPVGNGSMGLFLGPGGGRSPIIVLLSNVNSGGSTGDILVGENLALPDVGNYVPNSVFEFTLGVDFDNQNYEVSARNVTAGTAAVQLVGSGPGGRFPFFGGAIGDDGDGATYTLDASLLLRSGTGRIDDINLAGDPFVQAVWSGDISGNWNQNERWIPNLIPGTAEAGRQIAVFGSAITTPQTVFTNSTVNVNGVRFDNANTYAIAGGGRVELKATSGGTPVNPTINVIDGNHEFQVEVGVLDNTTVTVAPGGSLNFNNDVSLGGKTLTTSGAVGLNVGVTGGGLISNSGELGTAGTTPIVADLNSTGTLVIDLGPNNTDFFNITGNATLSGLVDIVLEPGYAPSGMYTVLAASGTLSAGSLALHPSDIGTFSLSVTANSVVLSVAAGVPGDYNANGAVDAADYVMWRKRLGQTFQLTNEVPGVTPGMVTQEDYAAWRARFGNTSGSGSGPGGGAAVPEPTAVAIALLALVAGGAIRRTKTGAVARS